MICFTANKIFWIGDDMETLKDLKLKLIELEDQVSAEKEGLIEGGNFDETVTELIT